MGVVYSPEEVALGQYPARGDHERLGKALLDTVKHSEHIRAGVVYGSTAVGIANRRSDVDFLAICKDGSFTLGLSEVLTAKETAIAAGNYARVEEHFESDAPFKKTGQVDVQYLAHFARIIRTQPTWGEGDPLSHLSDIPYAPEQLGQSVREYVRSKAGKFGKVAASTDVDYADLQRAFELPVAITRKVKQILRPYFSMDATTEDKKSMARIGTELLTHPKVIKLDGAAEAARQHEELVRLDSEYSKKLEAAIVCDDVKEYEQWLDIHHPQAIVSALVLSRSWQRVLDELE